MMILRILSGLLGVVIVGGTLISAIKTFILPRGINVWLTAVIFRTISFFFRISVKRATYERRDRVMALFAPVTLFFMPMVFLLFVLIGYMFIFWAINQQSLYDIFKLSGSSLLTLGYASVETPLSKIVEFSEAMIGLILVALLIAYLPSIYASFSSRETNVALLEGFAGSPPSAVELLARSYRTAQLNNLSELWQSWIRWFAELEESHTSFFPLAFFRSPMPERSWVTSAGVILDAASLRLAAIDGPQDLRAAFCIRIGFLALRQIADFFNFPYDANPASTDPISISQDEFNIAYDELLERGIPMKPDREQAWRDFAGWRVNYDSVLLALASFTMAPYAMWVSDRSAIK